MSQLEASAVCTATAGTTPWSDFRAAPATVCTGVVRTPTVFYLPSWPYQVLGRGHPVSAARVAGSEVVGRGWSPDIWDGSQGAGGGP